MAGTEETYHYTKEDLRKLESREAKLHDGNLLKDSESIVDSKKDDNAVAERQANLPLPEQPPVASDWNSADQRTVNVGSGGIEGDVSYGKGSSGGLRGPATADSSVRTDGEEWKTNTAPDSKVGRQ
ncbi:MAG: hypothetical protein M1834_002202 [Cirrosporium novae-zelandiae]|nr:MAG: hypothetical protein M1834_002202 [Cirrosporium novae-zelandiae]